MNTHPAPPSGSRLTGIALAIGVHAILILGFASAFVIQHQHKSAPPPEVTVIKDDPRPPEPQPKPLPTDVRLTAPDLIEVPPIPFDISPPTNSTVVTTNETPTLRDPGPSHPPVAPALPQAKPAVQSPGDVCTKMSSPVMPSVTGSGEALFRVTASTLAGRVTHIEIQALRNTLDGRSLRAFRSSIETALREGYECPGNVSFVQEFQFRLE